MKNVREWPREKTAQTQTVKGKAKAKEQTNERERTNDTDRQRCYAAAESWQALRMRKSSNTIALQCNATPAVS
jgi:hypothetical protein